MTGCYFVPVNPLPGWAKLSRTCFCASAKGVAMHPFQSARLGVEISRSSSSFPRSCKVLCSAPSFSPAIPTGNEWKDVEPRLCQVLLLAVTSGSSHSPLTTRRTVVVHRHYCRQGLEAALVLVGCAPLGQPRGLPASTTRTSMATFSWG